MLPRRKFKGHISRFVAAVVLFVSIASAAHAIETKSSQHDDRRCSVCASLHFSASGLIGVPVVVPEAPATTFEVPIFSAQTQKSAILFHFGARAPPLS